jgi:pantothenate synthetase
LLGTVVLVGAIRIGKVRLIDNRLVQCPHHVSNRK